MEKVFIPQIASFLCKWCSYTGADLAGTSRLQYPASIIPIKVMCSSRVDPVFLIWAFMKGSDGVLIGGCHPGDCHYQTGNYHTRRRFAILQSIFDSLGLEKERLRLSWISASEGSKFARVCNEFTQKIQEMGPNPTRKNMFLYTEKAREYLWPKKVNLFLLWAPGLPAYRLRLTSRKWG